jgi:SagB-type dehydrogenase family enzyme
MLKTTPAIRFDTRPKEGGMSLEACIQQRRSIRSFRSAFLTKEEVGHLLWAGQGITGSNRERSVPSAGALYPLVLGVVAEKVDSIPAGVYRYSAPEQRLVSVSPGECRERLVSAALDQDWIGSASAVLFIAGAFDRTTSKYRERGRAYVVLEAGLAAENIMLQAVSLGLGATMVGAFSDPDVASLLSLGPREEPLCLIAVGKP